MPLQFAPTKKGKFVLLALYVMAICCWMISFVWVGFAFMNVDTALRLLTTQALTGLAEEFMLALFIPPVLIIILLVSRRKVLRQP
jgi:hypothetical protein